MSTSSDAIIHFMGFHNGSYGLSLVKLAIYQVSCDSIDLPSCPLSLLDIGIGSVVGQLESGTEYT